MSAMAGHHAPDGPGAHPVPARQLLINNFFRYTAPNGALKFVFDFLALFGRQPARRVRCRGALVAAASRPRARRGRLEITRRSMGRR